MKKYLLIFGLSVGLGFAPSAQALIHSSNLPDFSQLAEENSASVVNISTSREAKSREAMIPPQFRGLPDDFLRHFFGVDPNQPGQKNQPKRQSVSTGSGFVISDDGYILTNHHVIDGADEVMVRMSDRQEFKAEVIGSDPRTDVALLKIKAKNLPVVKIGNTDNLKVGAWVLAIGAPFGLDYTVTSGIVSAKGRNLPDDTYVPFIQTDVAINPGNSGGPLINLDGEVVGINAQIYTRSGGFMGLSFAIPIEIAMNVVEQLKQTGKVERGFLGVQVQEVTSDLARSFNMEKPTGALVAQTQPDTPAEKAGIEPGDIILSFDGKKIEKSADLPPAVGMTALNKTVKVELLRQGKHKTISLQLASLDEASSSEPTKPGVFKSKKLGAHLEALSADQLKKLNLPFGVGVAKVEDDSLASNTGLRQGDVLVSINFKPIRKPQDVDEVLLAGKKNQAMPVRIIRNGNSMFLSLELD